MEIQLDKVFKFIFLFLALMSVKGQKYSEINFFDKKYSTSYSLDANLQMPTKTFYSHKIGEFTVYYIGKTDELKKSWYNFDSKNGLSYEESPDDKYLNKLDKLIANKLNKKGNLYNIFAEYTESKFIKNVDNELFYKYPLVKKIYKYNRIKNKWLFIRECNISSGNENTLSIDFFNVL